MFDQTMNSHTFTLEAAPENFAAAQKQVRAFLEPCSCSMRTLLELDMLVEEIFINIANYAYPNGTGTAAIDLALNDNNDTLFSCNIVAENSTIMLLTNSGKVLLYESRRILPV